MDFNTCDIDDFQRADMLLYYEDSIYPEISNSSYSDTVDYSKDSLNNPIYVIQSGQKQTTQQLSNSKKGIPHKHYLKALKKFFTQSKSRSKPDEKIESRQPKKEYIRTKLIRGHKRAIRQAITNQFPKKTIHKVDEFNKKQNDSWEKFKDFVSEAGSQIIKLSKTENGPLTDGKNRRLLENPNNLSCKTWNDDSVKVYFSNKCIRESFKLYIDVIFAIMDCDELCCRFGFSCCQSKTHLARCLEAWSELHHQLKNEFINIHLENYQAENPCD